MKITVEVDLPWVDDNGHLHDEMECNVIESITRKINNQILIDLKPKIDSIMNDSINNAIDTILHDYLSKPVAISNGFKKDEYESIYDMVEKKFGALYDMEIQRKAGSCGTDPLLVKLDSKIKQSMNQLLGQVEMKIEKESKTIASNTLKESSLYAAIKKVGISLEG